ncbi:MAG: Eco57I restriction-modification methylase domain-containing protein [Verrucomicrobia bacterium]|nr:Eco57I restriction-modification methylase domain-containing protein [Verrucomicrobiota bacterium]
MEKKQLQNIILSAPYKREVWHDVLKQVFGVKILYSPARNVPIAANDIAKEAVELGNFYTADERLVGVYEITLKEDARTKLAFNKVGLRNLLRSIYKYDVDGALIVFVQGNKWRFSYVSETSSRETEPKRYTYLFGTGESCRTAAERFYNLKDKKIYLQDLFDAFSVDKLNQDFFKSYNEFYKRAVAHLTSDTQYYKWLADKKQEEEDKKQKPIRDYVKKLLGRIVFLHFLQKKGWLGIPEETTVWEGGDKQFMQNLFSQYPAKDKFNSKCLYSLFFETLNTNRKEKNYLAPGSLFAGRKSKFRIPYLNGGLFDNTEIDNYKIDFPESYFSSLFDFFEQYNFTIDENDPYDSEVGIDPEMLGHIFENLLEENREKGTFYTPKEIVYYICHDSIIEYLVTQMPDVSRDDFEALVRHNKVVDAFTNQKTAQRINDLLKAVKVCDPAIGSGAFPMGMMKEIFECRRLLYPYLKTNEPFYPAIVKKEIIENNIYGVDIEAGATDIARLRFWLALVVDEIEPHPLPNLDYKIIQGNSLLERFEGIDLSHVAKPNVKLFEPQKDLFGNIKENQLQFTYTQTETVEEIQQLMKDFFRLENAVEKQKTREKINEYVHKHIQFNIDLRVYQLERWIAEIEETNAKTNKQDKKLLEYQEALNKLKTSQERLYELEKSNDKPFFLWHLFFNDVFENGGFDIVIGNPPYIQLQKMGKEADALQDAGFSTFARTGDIYCLFYEQAHKILKPGGNLIYITGSAWLRSNYGKALRRFFIQETNPIQLIDLSDCQIFQSATVLTTIFQYKKERNANRLKSLRLTRKTQQFVSQLSNYFKENGTLLDKPGESAWSINDKEKSDIKKDVLSLGKALKHWDIDIVRGIVTGLNEAFIINKSTKEDLVKQDNNSAKILKPLLRGRDLGKYTYRNENLWLIGTFPTLNLDINDFPAIKDYLLSFGKERLEQSGEDNARKKTGNEWFETQDQISYWQNFEQPKILYPNMVKDISFTYDDRGFYTNQKCFILTGEKIKYLLGILNSKLFRYCFEEDFPELQGNSREINKVVFEEIPIKYPNEKEEELVSTLVDYILYLYDTESEVLFKHTPNNRIASTIEEVLNMVVYELYFHSHMKETGLSVMNDLWPDSLQQSKNKAQTIIAFYKWLQHPENKVRNKIIAVDLKSPYFLSRINASTK